jgi:23S rRNA (guanosine2251-2'-O)-methyltransferase
MATGKQGISGGGQGKGRGGQGVARGGQGGRAAKAGSHRKGAPVGSGGQHRRRLEPRGATPPAEQRTGHPAARRAAAAGRSSAPGRPAAGRDGRADAPRQTGDYRQRDRPGRPGPETAETVAGRNAVVEALRARVPATALYLAAGLDRDERITEAVAVAGKRGIALLDVTRTQLDRMTQGALHQGVALQVPPYAYADPDDLLARALTGPGTALFVALDGVTDPRNLGAVVRSAAAFGASGVLIPQRRAAGMTAAAWKSSAGAAARLPVARVTNLVRALTTYRAAGLFVIGLAADGEVELDDLELAADPLVVVVGAEDTGLSRLVTETCDMTVRIPMAAASESLNAGIAAAVALAEVARRRRAMR